MQHAYLPRYQERGIPAKDAAGTTGAVLASARSVATDPGFPTAQAEGMRSADLAHVRLLLRPPRV